MCGILAQINYNNEPIKKDLFVKMRDTMRHRGPDDADVYINGPVALGHRRLSIIDLSENGRQPMKNEDQTIYMVCNGEIYNYVEIREELERKGHRFSSASDSEVIIHQYEEDGEDCLKEFNGMFSFVLWDSKKKYIFAARDRLGIKPLYYYNDTKKIILASEVKAIIEDPSIKRIPDYQALADFCYAGRPLGNKTMFKGVKEIEPGCKIGIDHDKKSILVNKYWDVEYDYKYSRSNEQVTDELFSLLDDAVKIHCRSDATLGGHLSGGLDSSIVVALAAKYRTNLKTFSIKFSDDPYIDETRYAKAVAAHVKADYHESSPPAVDMVKQLPYLLWHMDMPMTTEGVFAYLTVSQLAKKYVKVTLTGHGGDELFAGYPAQFQAAYNDTSMFEFQVDPVRRPKYSLLKRLSNKITNYGILGIYKSIKSRFALNNNQGSIQDLWGQLHCGDLPKDSPIFCKNFLRDLQGYSPQQEYFRPFLGVNTNEILDRCLYHDLRVYLPSLLNFEDRVSMSVSIESRVPLLDYRIVEFLATVPPMQKVLNMQPKYLLRRIGSTLLPEHVWKRKEKFNFSVPGSFWYSESVRGFTRNILLSSECLDRGIFKPRAIKDSFNNMDVAAGRPWLLLNIELWFRLFIEQDTNFKNVF